MLDIIELEFFILILNVIQHKFLNINIPTIYDAYAKFCFVNLERAFNVNRGHLIILEFFFYLGKHVLN